MNPKIVLATITILFLNSCAKSQPLEEVVNPIVKQIDVPKEFGLDNGIIHLKQDLTRGGAISYLSKSGVEMNIVNTSDEGRYIQQSYYAGYNLNRQPEGQSPSWSPWPWNPIQVGDAFGNRAQILESSKTDSSTYAKCIPMLWDMKNMPAEAEIEQWTELSGNVLKIKNKITSHRTDNIYSEGIPHDQELPAIYLRFSFSNLYSYFGNAPFTGDKMDNPAVVNLSSGFWGRYEEGKVTENWMAFVDDKLWGIGVYNPITKNFLAGTNGETNYIAPIKVEIFNRNTAYEYEYYLIIGNLTEIRSAIYNIHNSLNKSEPK